MLLSPLSSSLAAASEEVPVPAPSWFRGINGHASRVWLEEAEKYTPEKGDTAARKAGLHYEAKVQQALMQILPGYMAAPKVTFVDKSGMRFAIPDGIYAPDKENLLTVFEIKFSHVPDAWWQLEKKYRPLLEIWRPNSRVLSVEIVRTFDSAVPFPCKFEFLPSLEALFSFVSGAAKEPFGVFQWRP